LEEHYNNILRIIENMTLVMERSPSAFAKMEEEHIRFHYLVQLNGQYDGAAVGEAFNFEGKTDILVRHQNHNLFMQSANFGADRKVLRTRLIKFSVTSPGATRKPPLSYLSIERTSQQLSKKRSRQ